MSLDLLFETSYFPSIAKKYLKVLIESKQELYIFSKYFKSIYGNPMYAVAEFRLFKLNSRKVTLQEFKNKFNENKIESLEWLFLYPFSQLVINHIIKPLEDGEFTLEELFFAQQENQVMNPVLLGKSLQS